MNILIIGPSGLIGRACYRLFTKQPEYKVLGTYFGYKVAGLIQLNTLSNIDKLTEQLKGFTPNVIIHTGALTHVDYCEDHEEESFQATVQSTINVCQLATIFNSKVVYISTDYVFDGTSGPYSEEEEEVNPLSIYAKHKLEAELYVRNNVREHSILRVTNVYGDEMRGKNFISRLIQLGQSGEKVEMNLPIDQYATPVNAIDVARSIKLLLENNQKGVWNISSTDYLNRVQLANKVLGYFENQNVIINSKSTEELNQKAPRPLKGGLYNLKFHKTFPDFKFSSVDDYMKGKIELESPS